MPFAEAIGRRPDKPVAYGSGTLLVCLWQSQAAVTAGLPCVTRRRTRLPEVMLLSNSFSPGHGALEHAMDALSAFFAGTRRVLFIAYAASDPDSYATATREILGRLGVQVSSAHRAASPLAALDQADAVFVGGGNAFRLLQAVRRSGLLAAIGSRSRAGMPYLGVSAGANLACPTIRTTNDMPVVQPMSLAALGLVPFQVNPHYPVGGLEREGRDGRLAEFLEENDVPVLGLCEGSWLRVSGTRATLGGVADGRLLARGRPPRDVQPGDDLSALLDTIPRYDSRPEATEWVNGNRRR
jgi:dipeptidase E